MALSVPGIPIKPLRAGRRLLASPLAAALASPNPIERFVGLVDPTWSERDVLARIVAVRRQTDRSITLTLRPNDNWAGFIAGQHIGLTLDINGVRTTRFYSPACSADQRGDLELTVTTHPDGKVSRHLAEHAAPGMVVGLSPADGEFVLPEKVSRPLLLISGGSGITPVMAMLRTLVDREHSGPVTFIQFTRVADDLIYADELEQIAARHPNVRIVHSVTRGGRGGGTRGDASIQLTRGRLTRRRLVDSAPDFAKAETFVCGPTALIDAAESIWQKEGIAKRLHSERFVLPEPIVVAEDATGRLSFTKSGIEIDNDGRPILVQAEDAGLTPQCGCRMGICHTCIAQIDHGAVRNVQTGEVTPISDELVRVCIHAPVGDVEIDL